VLYEFNISFVVCASTRLYDRMLSRICLVSPIGMFVYIFEMSKDAKLVVGVNGVCLSSWISCVVFVILKVYGNGVIS
jgi:hypothetical protein